MTVNSLPISTHTLGFSMLVTWDNDVRGDSVQASRRTSASCLFHVTWTYVAGVGLLECRYR